ncbi:hypothetical protein G9A89_012922 [Geosiphon pyriformis]|nr:hypothetical protein G9A89_012922 [Geosiphon pyriformis]
MDIEATTSSTISKKKTLKGTFHGPTSGSFSQKKKVVLGNVKYFGLLFTQHLKEFTCNTGNSVYSDVKSLSGEDENVSMSGANSGSLLGSAATTSKAK